MVTGIVRFYLHVASVGARLSPGCIAAARFSAQRRVSLRGRLLVAVTVGTRMSAAFWPDREL